MSLEGVATIVATISAAVQGLVILVTAPLIFQQLVELKRATMASALTNAFAQLQDEKVRKGRKILLEFTKANISDWTDEERAHIELACNAFDLVGIMISNGVIPAQVIVSEYYDGIIKAWENAQPLIQWNRTSRKRPDYWDEFEMLYHIAKKKMASNKRMSLRRPIFTELGTALLALLNSLRSRFRYRNKGRR